MSWHLVSYLPFINLFGGDTVDLLLSLFSLHCPFSSSPSRTQVSWSYFCLSSSNTSLRQFGKMSNYLWKSSPATTFYRFYDLPRELRDIIHGYAFGTAFGTDAETFKVVLSRSEWMNRENRRRSMAMWTAQLHRTNTSYEVCSTQGTVIFIH